MPAGYERRLMNATSFPDYAAGKRSASRSCSGHRMTVFRKGEHRPSVQLPKQWPVALLCHAGVMDEVRPSLELTSVTVSMPAPRDSAAFILAFLAWTSPRRSRQGPGSRRKMGGRN